MSAPWQICLPAYEGEGRSLLAAAGGSWRRLVTGVVVNARRWYRRMPPFDRRRRQGRGPNGLERRRP